MGDRGVPALRLAGQIDSADRLAGRGDARQGAWRKDERIRWFISAANRDPLMFADPDRFDITRQPNQHVAFGSGTHHCLGATLARVEGQEVFKALAERFPDMEIGTENFAYHPSITFRSLKSLPVSLH